eukprot:6194708-Pleurochrysis_carterae.AAC.1
MGASRLCRKESEDEDDGGDDDDDDDGDDDDPRVRKDVAGEHEEPWNPSKAPPKRVHTLEVTALVQVAKHHMRTRHEAGAVERGQMFRRMISAAHGVQLHAARGGVLVSRYRVGGGQRTASCRSLASIATLTARSARSHKRHCHTQDGAHA